MAGFVVIGTLAAFGLLCMLWALFGWIFSCGKGGFIVCLCRRDGAQEAFLQRVRLLRQLGLLKAPVVLVGTPQPVWDWIKKEDFELVSSVEGLSDILELERNALG